MHMCFVSISWRLPTNLKLESSSAAAKIFGIFKSRSPLLEIVFKKIQTYITPVNAPRYRLLSGIWRASFWLSTLIT